MKHDFAIYFSASVPFEETAEYLEALLDVPLAREEDELFGLMYRGKALRLRILACDEHGMLDVPSMAGKLSDYTSIR